MEVHTGSINWKGFKQQLEAHTDKRLQFLYAEGRYVASSFHITEIKQAPITSVDCGGVVNNWTEVVIQLWEPEADTASDESMQISKALSIMVVVEGKMKIAEDAIVKIEYGNSDFAVRQMYPAFFEVIGKEVVIRLSPDVTQCKAINRGGTCGTDSKDANECCIPADTNIKIKKPLVELTVSDAACCTPGGGCC